MTNQSFSRPNATTHGSSSSGRVNDMLHNMRGEQFRHARNLGQLDSSLIPRALSHNSPTIPIRFGDFNETTAPVPTSTSTPSQVTRAAKPSTSSSSSGYSYSGPPPPKSWLTSSLSSPSSTTKERQEAARQRAEALSLIFTHRPSSQSRLLDTLDTSIVPSLTVLCLRKILFDYSPSPSLSGSSSDSESTMLELEEEFIQDVVPCLPAHLRLELIRYAAIHRPLGNNKLRALLGPEGHAHGELLVVGPAASLEVDHFIKGTGAGAGAGISYQLGTRNVALSEEEDEDEHGSIPSFSYPSPLGLADRSSRVPAPVKDWDWDATDETTPIPLQSLILLSTRLSPTTFLSLPPTLTHIALLNLPSAISLHRLPPLSPLLVVLDLSFNDSWLGPGPGKMSEDTRRSILRRTEWERWSLLRVLGWRGCVVIEGMVERVNRGRWDDVEVVTSSSIASSDATREWKMIE